MKVFSEPTLEVIRFGADDRILTSSCDGYCIGECDPETCLAGFGINGETPQGNGTNPDRFK